METHPSSFLSVFLFTLSFVFWRKLIKLSILVNLSLVAKNVRDSSPCKEKRWQWNVPHCLSYFTCKILLALKTSESCYSEQSVTLLIERQLEFLKYFQALFLEEGNITSRGLEADEMQIVSTCKAQWKLTLSHTLHVVTLPTAGPNSTLHALRYGYFSPSGKEKIISGGEIVLFALMRKAEELNNLLSKSGFPSYFVPRIMLVWQDHILA